MNQSEYDELALKIAHDVISRGTTFYPEEIIEFANRLRVECRNEALEQAAAICNEDGAAMAWSCAKLIRDLKVK